MSNLTTYRNVTPVFGLLKPNPRKVASDKRAIAAARFAKAGDISQLGIRRAVVDGHLYALTGGNLIAYCRPESWSVSGAVAMRITLTTTPKRAMDQAAVTAVQEALRPKSKPTDAELIQAVNNHIDENYDGGVLDIMAHQVISFLGYESEGDDDIAAVAQKLSGNDMATRVGDLSLTVRDILDADVDDLSRIVALAKSKDEDAAKAAKVILAIKVFRTSPKLGMMYNPLAEFVDTYMVQADMESLPDTMGKHIQDVVRFVKDPNNNRHSLKVEIVLPSEITTDVDARDFVDVAGHRVTTNAASTTDALNKASVESTRARNNSKVSIDTLSDLDFNKVPAEGYDWISAVTKEGANAQKVGALASYGNWRELDLGSVSDDFIGPMVEFVFGVTNCASIDMEDADSELLARFAAVRAYSLRHRLYSDKSEMVLQDEMDSFSAYLPVRAETALMDQLYSSLAGPIGTFLTLHSYMKSGHNATANGLGHIAIKVIKSVTESDDPAMDMTPVEMGEFLGSACYPGCHFADQRLKMVHFKNLAKNGELSFSMSRRLSVLGPGTVAPFLLSRVLEALDDAKFFEHVGKAQAYKEFKNIYELYAENAQFETPYAAYMYGVSKAESTGFKNFIARYAHYAHALSEVMPDSTYNFSVAFKRDTQAAAVNSIAGNLEVKAFVTAYRRFITSLVTGKMAASSTKALASANTLAIGGT